MTAIVFGASGYTGRAVVRALRERGVATVAHLRPESGSSSAPAAGATPSPREALRAEWLSLGATIDSTPWDADAITAMVVARAPIVVFALLGTTKTKERADRAAGRDSSYAAVDVGMSLMALAGAQAAASRPRFVYLSALGTGPTALGAYYAARWQVEQAVVASGLPYVIARPAIIGGDREEARPGERFGLAVTDGILGALAAVGVRGPKERYGSRTAAQLGTALVRLGTAEGTASRVYRPEELNH